MPELPSPVLVAALKGLILETFDVSNDQARELASSMVASDEWGTDEDPAPIPDWKYRVKQELGVFRRAVRRFPARVQTANPFLQLSCVRVNVGT